MPDHSTHPTNPEISQTAEAFGNVPNPSEAFGKVPQSSEPFGTVPHVAERTENHTLTVREAARLFEDAGVARTERSIINWCQPNAQGIARLDAYYDPNERKYFITQASVSRAIEEEKSRASKAAQPLPHAEEPPTENQHARDAVPSEPFGSVRKNAATADRDEVEELESKVRDLEITNRVKDQVIAMKDKQVEQLQTREHEYIERLIESGHRIGELETRVMQLEAPDESRTRRLEVRPERMTEPAIEHDNAGGV